MVRPLVIGLVTVGARFEGWNGPCQQGKISLIKEKNDNNNVARHLEFRLCSHLRLVHMSTCLNHEVATGKTSWKTPRGKLPNMVYTGLCRYAGYKFRVSLSTGYCLRDWFDLVDEICLYSMTTTWKQDGVRFVRCRSIKISWTFTFLWTGTVDSVEWLFGLRL